MKLAVKTVMHIAGGIKVGLVLVVAKGAKEELSPFSCDPLACLVCEPHALAATPRTVLRSAVGIDFDADHRCCIRFFFRELVDFACELIGLFPVEPP